MDKINIGIVGNGFVGSAVHFGFSPQTGFDNVKIRVYDKDPTKSLHELDELVRESKFIFVSVPTPANIDGSMNLDILDGALNDIHKLICRNNVDLDELDDTIVLVRSTITPGSTRKLQQKYIGLNLVFNPEFLTARSAKFDFINQSRFILGGNKSDTGKVAELFRLRFGKTMLIIETNFETAEFIKYMNNCFFTTKISFLNEMYQIADKCDVDWNMAVEGFVRDGRIGHSHMNVPGPDGKFGFGGRCFPKDIQALICFAEENGVDPKVLKSVWAKNLEVRPEKD